VRMAKGQSERRVLTNWRAQTEEQVRMAKETERVRGHSPTENRGRVRTGQTKTEGKRKSLRLLYGATD
jgi:hypothetical protein